MRRRTSPRTNRLLRAYIALLAISVVLSAVLIERHLARAREPAADIVMVRPPGTPAPHFAGPMINWGGQKR